jgi:hypothetical protein
MFCMNCGRELEGNPETCLSCGARPLAGGNFCPECGAHITPETAICMRCGTKVGEKGRTRGSTAALTTGGILSIISGLLGALFGALYIRTGVMLLGGEEIDVGDELVLTSDDSWMYLVMGGVMVVCGVLAIVGGSYALKKKRFGLALAGAICSIFATATLCGLGIVLGITAVVLVAISKSKFKKQERESDVLQKLR